MTFGIIGEVFGTIGDILGYQRRSGAFVPEWCPVLKEGETHPHMLHSSKTDDRARTYMLNTLVDLQMISMECANTMGEAIISQHDRLEAMFEFQQKKFKSLNKSLKSFSSLGGKDVEDVLEKLISKLNKLTEKISSLEQVIKSINKVAEQLEDLRNQSDNTKINKAINTATKKFEDQEELLREISKQMKSQSKASQSLTPEVIQENLGKAFKKQDSQRIGRTAIKD